MPFLLLSQRPVTIHWIGLSPSFCWFACSLSALIKFSHRPCGTACALNTLAWTGTVACLHHQQPVGRSPIMFFSTDCAPPAAMLLPSLNPPHVVLQGKLLQLGHRYDIVTPPCPPAGAMMRRSKSVLFNIIHCTMLNLPASSSTTFAKASRILSKAHSVAPTSTLKMLKCASHSPLFQRKKASFIILGVQSVSVQHFTCSRSSLAGDSCGHWPCIRFLFFLSRHPS